MAAGTLAVLLFAGGVVRVMQPVPAAPRAADVHVISYLDFLRDIELLRRVETVAELRRLGDGLQAAGQGPAAGGAGSSPAGGALSDAHTAAELLHRAAEAAAAAAREAETNLIDEAGGDAISATAMEGADG